MDKLSDLAVRLDDMPEALQERVLDGRADDPHKHESEIDWIFFIDPERECNYNTAAWLAECRDSFAAVYHLAPEALLAEFPELEAAGVRVWEWDAAPEFRYNAGHGGDEDWVALVPHPLWNRMIEEHQGGDVEELLRARVPWAKPGSFFGCCDVNAVPIEGGMLLVGAHA